MDTFFCVNNWNQTARDQFDRYMYYTPRHDGVWKDLRAVNVVAQTKYLVIMDGLPKDSGISLLRHPRKIFFQREPQEIKQITLPPDPLLFQGSYDKHFHIATWMLKLPFKQLANLRYPDTIKPLSAVMSAKVLTPGQLLRLRALQKISATVQNMDVYGRGLNVINLGQSYKGSLDYNGFCKFKGLYGYAYSLAFENSRHVNYFTEKIIDCFLSWTKPIYWGCPNISDFFPKSSYIEIDIQADDIGQRVAEEISKPVDINALREARELVLHKYSLWPSVRRVIDLIASRRQHEKH